ncbi:ABC transporter ATP-binding protein [Acuticoccus mangrovi]|uniref:ABC transporter ATP-binding protein n=1 Tax=Acuticoccus mangrovi TaxID=2796142 RepID=A0A934IK18_9HYPH|nr:ABC transporter ATP-binding protein [Acuticoccus mangrovi]MBJ3777918.1 ABC transporter ATP-binding protein [Acuticoccus mangrovi]
MGASPLIEMRDVHLTLGRGPTAVPILRGVDLSVDGGRSVGVIGPSGSGKSTLLMVLGGLERPDAGSVRISGEELTAMDEDALTVFRGRSIGIVFQSFHLIPTMTALENVAVPLELAGVEDAIARARAELAAVGLGERTGHYPTELSGGEQQRVAIARALAPRPAVLLADEPTGNLDDATGRDIIELMFAVQEQRRQTLLLVTHDRSLAARCDECVRMRQGRIDTEVAA